MKKPYWALSEEQKKKVHNARIAAKYTYKKRHFTIDEQQSTLTRNGTSQ